MWSGNNLHILVVEDNIFTQDIITHALLEGGFMVDRVTSGEAALQHMEKHGVPDLAIVDLHMPGMGGFELCEAVRRFSSLPIIILTAVQMKETVIQGLELYADDYIVKPFSPQELVARVNRVLRRVTDFVREEESTIQIDDQLTINFLKQEVMVKGSTISLTPNEAKLLYLLVHNAGRLLPTELLQERVWSSGKVHKQTVFVNIHRLRQKIEPDPENPRRIEFIDGIGYRFNIVKPGQ